MEATRKHENNKEMVSIKNKLEIGIYCETQFSKTNNLNTLKGTMGSL
jgi:hypothetical protein